MTAEPAEQACRTICGDALDVLPTLAADSADALVTDPPAGIGFLGKEFDSDRGGRDRWIEWLAGIMRECLRVVRPGAWGIVWALPRTSHWTATALEDAGFEIRDRISHLFGQGWPKSRSCLKPGCEDWWLIRKPARSVGSLPGLDACRIPASTPALHEGSECAGTATEGRWPANLVLDEAAAAMLDEQSGTLTSGSNCVRRQEGWFGAGDVRHDGLGQAGDVQTTYGDTGGASRFFYCAKASQRDRGAGNKHPCVKSTPLMRYLCRLVTPKGGLVLDPFMGSGSTGLAASEEGVRFIGIERDPAYFAMAEARLNEPCGPLFGGPP